MSETPKQPPFTSLSPAKLLTSDPIGVMLVKSRITDRLNITISGNTPDAPVTSAEIEGMLITALGAIEQREKAMVEAQNKAEIDKKIVEIGKNES